MNPESKPTKVEAIGREGGLIQEVAGNYKELQERAREMRKKIVPLNRALTTLAQDEEDFKMTPQLRKVAQKRYHGRKKVKNRRRRRKEARTARRK